MNRLLKSFFTFCSVLLSFCSYSQYILNGNARQESCNCYQLTDAQMWQGGSVWQSTKIDLRNSFDFSFNIYAGCIDADGADGLVFMLQPLSTSLGASGGGIGFGGVAPSVGIVLDTWQNATDNDPAFDHISIQANGIISHGNDLAGPVPASASGDNIEDCKWHVLRIKWDAGTHALSTYFDDILRLSTQVDLVTTIFKSDPMVYWGFSAATGGKFNVQKFCTALNPVFNSGLNNDAVCLGTPVTFSDNSTSFTTIKSYHWDFGDGSTSVEANPPPHIYSQPGIYKVSHSITAMDNCESEPFIKTIKIGDKPTVDFQISDTCEGKSPQIQINEQVSVGNIGQWNWQIDGAPFSTNENADFTKLTTGSHSVELNVVSDIGCASNIFKRNVTIKPAPKISFETADGCLDLPVLFSAQQQDQNASITSWHWDFGSKLSSGKKDTIIVFTKAGNFNVQLSAKAPNGCETTFSKNVFINKAVANAGNDTLVIPNTFFQLNGSGGSSYTWDPATGLNNPLIANPTGNISENITYHLTVKTTEGCTDTASVKVSVFKGSQIYVPTAFTPNGDGLNDILKPYYVSISSVSYFTIYNSWGQKVFSTHELTKGWDGNFKGQEGSAGTYVWVLKAVDPIGKEYNLKGVFLLIR